MSAKSTLIVALTVTLAIVAPPLVAMSAVPRGGGTLAVLLPPWMDADAQLAALAATGVLLREGGTRLAGLGPRVWVVEVPDADSARNLAALPALLLPGTAMGCGPRV